MGGQAARAPRTDSAACPGRTGAVQPDPDVPDAARRARPRRAAARRRPRCRSRSRWRSSGRPGSRRRTATPPPRPPRVVLHHQRHSEPGMHACAISSARQPGMAAAYSSRPVGGVDRSGHTDPDADQPLPAPGGQQLLSVVEHRAEHGRSAVGEAQRQVGAALLAAEEIGHRHPGVGLAEVDGERDAAAVLEPDPPRPAPAGRRRAARPRRPARAGRARRACCRGCRATCRSRPSAAAATALRGPARAATAHRGSW